MYRKHPKIPPSSTDRNPNALSYASDSALWISLEENLDMSQWRFVDFTRRISSRVFVSLGLENRGPSIDAFDQFRVFRDVGGVREAHADHGDGFAVRPHAEEEEGRDEGSDDYDEEQHDEAADEAR